MTEGKEWYDYLEWSKPIGEVESDEDDDDNNEDDEDAAASTW